MHTKEWAKTSCASLMIAALMMQPVATLAQGPAGDWSNHEKVVEIATEIGRRSRPPHAQRGRLALSHAWSETRTAPQKTSSTSSFSSRRTGPLTSTSAPTRELGACSRSRPAKTPGFVQPIVLTDGSVGTISPFLIPQSVTDINGNTVLLYPEDTDSVNHGHTAIDAKLDLDANQRRPERSLCLHRGRPVGNAERRWESTYTGPAPTEKQVQKGELVVSHVDCDTAPFLWNYADRFTLFDNFFDTVIGPSTPNAIAMIAGQSGKTQWVKHPALGSNVIHHQRATTGYRRSATLLGIRSGRPHACE